MPLGAIKIKDDTNLGKKEVKSAQIPPPREYPTSAKALPVPVHANGELEMARRIWDV